MEKNKLSHNSASPAAKVGMAAVLAASMAVASPVAAYAAGEGSDTGTSDSDETTVQASPEGSGESGIATQSASNGYYYVSDNYPDINQQIISAAGQGYTKVHVGVSYTGKGTFTVPSSLTEIAGYSEGWFSEGPKTVDFGYSYPLTVSFPAGSNISVDRINFAKANKSDAEGATAVVEKGAVVHFSNCRFDNTPVVNGTAIFEDCAFTTGKIENNGSTTYTGSTKEPENIGKESEAYQSLALSHPSGKVFPAAVTGDAVDASLPFEVKGTKAESAEISASVVDANGAAVEGLSATVADGNVKLSGTAPSAGSYSVVLTAVTTKEDGSADTASEALSFQVQEQIKVKLSGDLQCFVANGTSVQSGEYDVVATSTGGGGSSSATQSNKLKPEIQEGDGEWEDWNTFATRNSDASISFSVSPEGSGMQVGPVAYDTVFVTGTPQTPGTYYITATVTSGARTQQSEPVEMRIYSDDQTLQQRMDVLPENTSEWDMEPYEIAETGNAVVPVGLHDIYGSHESGVYGIIGKGENGNFATETLTIPAGADVTLHNMKVYSSVKIVVEAGGKLTLDDSVAYGAVEVNGGTLSARNYSAFVNQITLNDGSALEDAEIRSHANYLTDGNYKVEAPEAPVVVNGTVTVKGACSVEGEGIVSSKDAQTGIVVEQGGKLVISQGATLTATGGSVDIDGGNGGAGVKLKGGSIIGDGTLVATGGSVGMGGGDGGSGIAGNGTVAVAKVKATGGNTVNEGDAALGEPGNAGNGIDSTVLVSANSKVTSQGGSGANPGSSDVTRFDGANNGGSDNGSGNGGANNGGDSGNNGGSDNGSGSGGNGGDNGSNGGSNGSDGDGNGSGANGGSDGGNGSDSGAGSDSGNDGNDGSNGSGSGSDDNSASDTNDGSDQDADSSNSGSADEQGSLPGTGDTAPLGAAAGIAAVAAGAAAFIRKRIRS